MSLTKPSIEESKITPHRLNADDFSDVLHDTLNERLRDKINKLELTYEPLTANERDQCILTIIRTLQSPTVVKTGSHRIMDWEKGWGENLQLIESANNLDSLLPLYFGKHEYVRWKQEFVRAKTDGFDYKVLNILVEWMLDRYMSKVDNIFEFGCGPGYHLAFARSCNPRARLVGLDWATNSQAIISNVVKKGFLSNLEGRNFNFFNPDYTVDIPPNTGIYTVAALEQIGPDSEAFIQFLLNKRPTICAHIEPIDELLDENNLVDSLSIYYFRKRNYLHRFLPRLQALEKEGRIVIHNQQRTYTGSFFIEGHSLIAWSPV